MFGISVRFLFMVVTANLKASSSTLIGSFSRVSKIPPAGREGAKVFFFTRRAFPMVTGVLSGARRCALLAPVPDSRGLLNAARCMTLCWRLVFESWPFLVSAFFSLDLNNRERQHNLMRKMLWVHYGPESQLMNPGSCLTITLLQQTCPSFRLTTQ